MKRVLVVDDSVTIITMLKAQLEQCGYEALTASSGDEALQKAEQDKPSLILLDVVMPQKDGFQTLRELKARPATKHIPVIMLSAKGDTSAILQGEQLGAADYVIKDGDPKELLELVQQHLY